jgi:alpha-glucosidase
LHQFLKEQPDLNVRNADVVSELKKILQFWLDRGVDGFRMDAVSHLFEDKDYSDEKVTSSGGGGYDSVDHSMTNNLPEVLDLLEEFRDVLDTKTEMDEYNPRIMMTEAYLPTESVMEYYGTNFTEHAGSISHMPMNFAFIEELNSATDVTADKVCTSIKERQPVYFAIGHFHQNVMYIISYMIPV